MIVVGVAPDQADAVVEAAADLGEDLGAEVVLVHVDPLEQVVRDRSGAPHLVPVDPARELGRLADAVGARLVVVGARRPGVRGRVGELLTGSVAVRLVHHQHRPVLVVPPAAPAAEEPASWE